MSNSSSLRNTRKAPQRLVNHEITALGFDLVAKVEALIGKISPDILPSHKEALLDYIITYADRYNSGSKGKIVGEKSLEALVKLSVEELQKRMGELPQNITTSFMQEQAARKTDHHRHIFGNNDRLYFTLPEATADEKIPSSLKKQITARLKELGFEHVDFSTSIAGKTADDKNKQKVGRILNGTGEKNDQQLIETFSKALSGGVSTNDVMMVVSRSPEDIARMSTARGWTSCMAEHGSKREYVEHDITHGTLVVYLVKKDDPNITAPLSRRLLKPFLRDDGAVAMLPDNPYTIGAGDHPVFRRAVMEFAQENFNKDQTGQPLTGIFKLHPNLYQDGPVEWNLTPDGQALVTRRVRNGQEGEEVRHLPDHLRSGNCTAEELLAYLGIAVEVEDKGQKYVNRDVDLSNHGLTALPDFSSIIFRESFNISNNPDLISLNGSPQSVGGYFDCSGTQITSLAGAPQSVGRDFGCYNTQITSLAGAPQSVGSSFDCSDTQITSLAGGPQSVGGGFNCSNTQITSLAGGPQSVGGGFNCSNTQITSLEHLPEACNHIVPPRFKNALALILSEREKLKGEASQEM